MYSVRAHTINKYNCCKNLCVSRWSQFLPLRRDEYENRNCAYMQSAGGVTGVETKIQNLGNPKV